MNVHPSSSAIGDPPMPMKPFKQDQLQLPSGNLFTRLLTTRTLATLRHCREWDVAAKMWPNDKTLQAALLLRAASNPAMVSVAGWAAELTQKVVADAVEALSAAACAVEVMSGGLVVSWDGYGAISVPTLVASAANGGFVAEGQPIPVRQFATQAALINPYKTASICVLTREMVESSNAEALISDALVKSAGMAIDATFFGSTAATAAAPAGIRNGIAALTPSASTDAFEAFFDDISSVLNSVGPVGGRGPFYIIGNVGRYGTMRQRFVFEDPNLIVLPTSAVGADLVAIASKAVAAAISIDPDIETVNAAALVMDTAPGPAGTMGPERSVWQTDSVAVKVRWPVSWVLRDPRGVAWTTPVWK